MTQSTARIELRCPPDDKRAFEAAAARDGFNSLAAWMLWRLRRASKKSREK